MDGKVLFQQVAEMFPAFGVNKRREIHRLLVEILRREGSEGVLGDIPKNRDFHVVKEFLVRRRYPDLSHRGIAVHESFAAFEVDPLNRLSDEAPRPFSPGEIWVEKGEEEGALVKRFLDHFPSARLRVGDDPQAFRPGRGLSAIEYNRRSEKVFIVRERHDFFQACPCSPGALKCGYHNANLGIGCPYECSYCFLQSYTNAPGIMFPSNPDAFLKAFASYQKGVRVGSGEFTDSLAFDHITQFSACVVEGFRDYPESTFEFKTKSANIDVLLSVPAASNIVVGWSVNPEPIASREERGAASLDERLEAARRVAAHGYRTAFHFDPIILYDGWQEDYSGVVQKIAECVPSENIAWISLGTLRMNKDQKKMIENRFPQTTILNAELLTRDDGKIRYHETVREEIYRQMLSFLREKFPKAVVYLCMETQDMWRALGLSSPWK